MQLSIVRTHQSDLMGMQTMNELIASVADSQYHMIKTESLFQAMQMLLLGKIPPYLIPHYVRWQRWNNICKILTLT